VNKALSIQAHPDKALAKKLRQIAPQHYPDDNHKPEMAIALGTFEALCGFRDVAEIVEFFENIPELASLTTPTALADLKEKGTKEALKRVFADVMNCPADKASELIASFQQRPQTSKLETVCKRLQGEYPGEAGCFCVFLLNYLEMKEGDAIFLAANEPHAYLSGDCIECMALSDNVVRAGLTPKFRDLPTLLEMLTYKTFAGFDALSLKPVPFSHSAKWKLYKAPVEEFSVIRVEADRGQEQFNLPTDGIMICIKGSFSMEADNFVTGSVLFLKAGSHSLENCNHVLAFIAISNP